MSPPPKNNSALARNPSGEFWFSEYVKCSSFDSLLLTQGFEFLTLVLVWVNWISDRFYLGDIGDFSDKELRVHT